MVWVLQLELLCGLPALQSEEVEGDSWLDIVERCICGRRPPQLHTPALPPTYNIAMCVLWADKASSLHVCVFFSAEEGRAEKENGV